jgi:UDP-3-O-[3-hydroxymyristoyl] glucosamine N-acyltransferase
MSLSYSLGEIASHVGGELHGDGARKIRGVASIASAGVDDLTFLESPKFAAELTHCRAAAVVASPDARLPDGMNVLRAAQPLVAWAQAVELLRPHERVFTQVSPQAYLGRCVEIGAGVGIGPGAYIGDGAKLGNRTEIYPGVTVGAGTSIGDDCRLYAGVHVYHSVRIGNRVIIHSGAVIGADGYGYVQEKKNDTAEPVVHRKVPQVGAVVIEDDVEIGANTTVDRAALDATVIGRGTKIDNLVMVGHNCRTGIHCLLVAQVGLSGSNELGNYVTVAGQAGLAGHLKVGDGATIGAKAGIMKDVDAGQVLLGSPALPAGLARRAYAQIEHLPEFRRAITDLQERVNTLEAELKKAKAGR